MLSIHQVAQVRAEHDPDTHWVKITFSDKWEHDTLTLHLYVNRTEDDNISKDHAFADKIANAINSTPRLESPAVLAVEATLEEASQ